MRHKINTIREIRVCIGGKHLCQPILATLAKLQETGGTEFGMLQSCFYYKQKSLWFQSNTTVAILFFVFSVPSFVGN